MQASRDMDHRSGGTGYWFPAKRYGWGWGLPCRWQGWVVAIIWLIAVLAGVRGLRLQPHPAGFILYTIGMCLALVAICWWKGEPPRWRWGNR